MSRSARAALTCVAVAACGRSEAGLPRVETRDSAGVRIVTNTEAASPATLPWLVGAGPDVDIGSADAEPAYQLFRVAGALQVPGGRVVVANAGSHELRFYDRAGRFLHAAGREGEGPGEFRDLGSLHRYRGDSLLVNDPRARRLSVFDADGRFGRSFAVQTRPDLPFANVIGVFADWTLLAQGFVQTGGTTPSGLQRYHNILYHLDAAAGLIDTLGTFPGTELYFEPVGNGGFGVFSALFGRSTGYLAAGTETVIASNDTYQVAFYAPDGRLTRIVRRAVAGRRVTDDDIARELARRVAAERTDDARRRLERVFAKLPHPAAFPAYGRVVIDDLLHLWVADYEPGREPSSTWTVFDPAGVMLGTVSLPEPLAPFHIGADFVLGTVTDALDVEHVRRYALSRR